MYEYHMGKKEMRMPGEAGVKNFCVEYIMMEKRLEQYSIYGISLIKETRQDKEVADTGWISSDRCLVENLIQKLMDCNITPYILTEVDDDWMGELSPL